MSLGEAIREALRLQDPTKADKIADFMRFNLGWNYEQSMNAVKNVAHGDKQKAGEIWETLLYESSRV